jgi:hypothetical protein
MAVTLPRDAEKTIAASAAETGVPTRVLLKDETLDPMLNQLANIQL